MSNDGILSQEEIDALLSRSGEATEDRGQSADMQLTEVEKDALGEIGNISYGSSATALSTILSQRVEITTPRVSVLSKEELLEEFNIPYVVLEVEFTEGLVGNNLMVLKIRDALIIANIMMGGDGQVGEDEELTDLHLSAVQEAMNQMMGSAATAMASMYQRVVNISPPRARIVNIQLEGDQLHLEDWVVRIGFNLRVGDLIDSTIMLLLPLSFAKEMVSLLLSGTSADPSPTSQTTQPSPQSAAAPQQAEPLGSSAYAAPASGAGSGGTQSYTTDASTISATPTSAAQPTMASAPAYGTSGPAYGAPTPPPQSNMHVSVQKPEFTPLFEQKTSGEVQNLDLLLDIPLQISVELGRAKKTIKDILELSPGSVIELDKLAGEPVDIFVNQKLIAHGEVVVIDENFGVRITNILDPRERLKRL